MIQSLYEGFGGLDLPIPAESTLRTFTDTDPARAVMAGLFRAAINAEFGARWAVATRGQKALEGTLPVQDVLELPPIGSRLKQRKTGFPLLCVYRDGVGTTDEHTLGIERLVQPWTVDYILGPLELGDVRKLLDVFQAVVKIVRLCIRRRGHPAYEDGALQFGPDKGDIGAIRLVRYEGPPAYQARFAGDDETIYHAVSLMLETVEYSRDNDDAYGFADGYTLQSNTGSEDEGRFPFYGDSMQSPEAELLTAAAAADDGGGVVTEFISTDGSGYIDTDGDGFIEFAVE